MKSNNSKQSALRRFKSRVLSSSCLAPSIVGQMQDEHKIESKVNESRATSTRKKKTLFGSIPDKIGLRFRRLLNLGTRSKNLYSSNASVSLQNEVSEEMVAIENNSQQNNRRIVSNWQEPLENSARFGRTLSVGRLRDRVLRRTLSNNVGGSLNREVWPDYLSSGLYNGVLENESGIMEFRGGNGGELLERSVFLERGRRIRSQVRALQRLGSRFENLSGHVRSCILSGRHQTGRCSCRESNHVVSANEDNTSTRSSISRIVLLAEALFEVLDEFHQRSVALTSPSSYSPLGSIPAPKEVVNTMPMKVYRSPQENQNEEAAQCYICLLEYEDGDQLRVLPCNHEFHRTCVDKWLKEIHRVCPLCRGDVCRSDIFDADKIT